MIGALIASPYSRTIIPIIFIFAVIIRIAFIHTVIGFDYGGSNISILNGDERDYIYRAENLLSGNGLTAGAANDRMWRTPAYPLLLSGIFLIFGKQVGAIRLLQTLLGGSVSILIFLIAQRVFDRTVATLAAFYFALYPPHVYMAGQILSENLLLPAALLAVLAFLKLTEIPSTRSDKSAFFTGALAGLAVLVKPESVVVAAAMIVALWLIGGEKKVLWCAALAVGVVTVVSPWIIRNYALSRHIVLSSVGGEAFWGGNNEHVLNIPKYRGYWMPPAEMPEQLKEVLAAPSEYDQDRVRWRLGWEFLDQHRGDIPRLIYYKLRRFYSVMVQDLKERIALILSFGLLLPFIAAGTLINSWRLLRERRAGLLLVAIILLYNGLAIVFWGSNRMRLVIDPMLIIFGIWAVRATVVRLLQLR